MSKQYTVENAYDRNDKVTLYENEKEKYYTILSDYEVPGYTTRLEEEGYARAYSKKEIVDKIEELKEDLLWYQRYYEDIDAKGQWLEGEDG